MYQSLNLPISEYTRRACGGWDGLHTTCIRLGINGVEGIWAGMEILEDFPPGLLVGYHLMFYTDWLDFYRGNRRALLDKFGSRQGIRDYYRGANGPEELLAQYREDLDRAKKLGAKYVVFHVSDVSNEEGYTYRWKHTNREVIRASVELINALLAEETLGMEFLVENQWWPGFTFTDPEETARLLDGIRYPRKGIMLDTGHLMNTNPDLVTERDGLRYITEMLDRHGSLSRMIRGIHLHQSLSGAYVREHTGSLPPDFPMQDAVKQFSYGYQHILQIDQHRPWTDPGVAALVKRIGPAYLTHELSAADWAAQVRATSRQIHTLQKGGLLDGVQNTLSGNQRADLFLSGTAQAGA